MTHKTEPDAVDRKILRLLATDGRSSYQAVADEVGLSRPAVMERVKRLEEAGYITGYGARVDRGKAGYPVTAFVAVRYTSSDYVGDEPRMRELEKHPGVLECHHVAGEDCYILKVAAPDLERLQRLLGDLRGPAPSPIVSTRTTIVLGTVFEKPGFAPAELD
ncbi:MAG TPA: Lrp/AsnC family transcriptional regulator [Gemmatimonadales bacterium]|nr:Lrp/AsnC family transcriptional regulator [Gemmatimonadales bacterium]